MDKKVGIIDYQMGNIRSVQKAFYTLDIPAVISNKADDLKNASHLILPGVGHFSKGMENIKKFGLQDLLNELVVIKGKPILGICLGMQLMSDFSEEGNSDGLSWIKGKTIRFKNINLKIPHTGWNSVIKINDNSLLNDINEESEFYFVHSYHVICDNIQDIILKSTYGIEFVSGFRKKNIVGLQFHPEKSHSDGLKLLKNFIYCV